MSAKESQESTLGVVTSEDRLLESGFVGWLSVSGWKRISFVVHWWWQKSLTA